MQPFVIHAHFYQPERKNPWTGGLDPEPSAAPDRDWNERIHRESYRPNGAARVYDHVGRVERIVNSYERLSFNFGPTLLRWMERHHPDTYRRVLDGDWHSVSRTGHGNALAQAYHHTILPLANERDRATQITWGLADFAHRFRRPAEGMWLPETAANPATLDALVDAGVRFTVLAPSQAHRVRSPDGEWTETGGSVDTGRAYRHLHSDGSGRSLAVVFYDGALAQHLAFDHAAGDAAALVDRLASSTPSGGGLVHAALDGETFGHHRPFGELALAYVLFEAADKAGLAPTSYAAWLAENPPVDQVQIVGGEGTAWSCAHGVGRWSRDCGCSTSAEEGWNQAWRAPLRAALDVVSEAAAAVFEERGGELLKDPWAARDDFIHLRLGDWTRTEYLQRHAMRHLSHAQRVDLWTLLESQRHAMVMYTSCGWFFADISGIETIYVMRFAARAIELLEELGATGDLRARVLDALGEARSNRPGVGTGADVWREAVEPARVSPARIGAHMALLALSDPEEATAIAFEHPLRSAGHEVAVLEGRAERRGRVALCTGRFTVTASATGRTHALAVAALHLGGLDFTGFIGEDPGPETFAERAGALWEAFPTTPMAQLIRRVATVFPEGADPIEIDLDWALPNGRQAIVGAVFGDLEQRFGEQYQRLYTDHRRILEMLTAGGYTLPPDLRAPAELTLSKELARNLDAIPSGDEDAPPDPAAFQAIRDLVDFARSQGYVLEVAPLAAAVTRAVTLAAARAARTLDPEDAEAVRRWLDLTTELGIEIDVRRAQEHAWEAAVRAKAGRLGAGERAVAEELAAGLGFSPTAWSGP